MTAFITPWGLYEWIRIPFGLSNAPACFERFMEFMETCLGDLRDKMYIPYLDDIIVFSETFQDHIEQLRKILTHLREHGVKLKPKRCSLFKREVTFLGRIVSADRYELDPASTGPVRNLISTSTSISTSISTYLYYALSFTVYTDNNPLTYVLSSAKLNAAGLRWIRELADFSFNIKYHPGTVHRDADTISRIPLMPT